MSAKTIAAPLPHLTEAPPLLRHLRNAARWLLQNFSRSAIPATRALVVEERVAIGPKKSLVLVRCRGQRFLVATAGDTIGPVIEVGPPKPASKPSPGTVRVRREREA